MPLFNLRVLILGSGGGAGRAISLYCGLAGCSEITLVNRTLSKAEELAVQLRALPSPPRVHVAAPDSDELRPLVKDAQLILQCSSLGMPVQSRPMVGSMAAAEERISWARALMYSAGWGSWVTWVLQSRRPSRLN